MTSGRKSPIWRTLNEYPAWCGKQFEAVFQSRRRSRGRFFVGGGLFGLMTLLLLGALYVMMKFGIAIFMVLAFLAILVWMVAAALLHQGAINFREWRFDRKYPRPLA